MTSPHKISRKSLGDHTNDLQESRKKRRLIFTDADAGYALFCFESPIDCSRKSAATESEEYAATKSEEYAAESKESATESEEYATESEEYAATESKEYAATESKESTGKSKESVAESKESVAEEDDIIFELMCCSPVLHNANSWRVISDE